MEGKKNLPLGIDHRLMTFPQNVECFQGLCEMKTLQELNIFRNKLCGDLPWCLANLTSLLLLNISSNDFSGNIAASPLINLTSLEYLALSNNGLQVPISLLSFFNPSKLKLLESLDNKLVAKE